jgi:hypothetical protein
MSDAWNPGGPNAPADYMPPTYRPLSALTVIALVLAIVFLVGAVLGFWWVEVLPVVLCVAAWGAISKGRRRGGGLAIAASVIAILGGLAGFGCAQAVRTGARSMAAPFVQALHDDDRATLERWASEEPDHPFSQRADLWKQRLDAGRARVGPWTKETEIAGSIWVPYRFAFPFAPPDMEEMGPHEGAAAGTRMSIWLRAPGERGDLWIGAELPDNVDRKELDSLGKDAAKDKERKPLHLVRDVRVFVPIGSK